jgi:hypothetical protein
MFPSQTFPRVLTPKAVVLREDAKDYCPYFHLHGRAKEGMQRWLKGLNKQKA